MALSTFVSLALCSQRLIGGCKALQLLAGSKAMPEAWVVVGEDQQLLLVGGLLLIQLFLNPHVSPPAELYEDMFLTPQRAAATRPQRKRNRTAGAAPQPVFT